MEPPKDIYPEKDVIFQDLIAVAKHFDIAKPQEIINEVCETALAFGDFAKEAGVHDSIAKQMLPEFRTYMKK